MAQSNKAPVSVFLVDDDACVREMATLKLKTFENISILGSASNTKTAFEEICRLNPRVILLDVILSGDFGPNLLDRLKTAMCDKAPLAIGFSCFKFETAIHTLLYKGAKGFHFKGDSWTDLIQGIQAVHVGGEYFSETIVKMFSNCFSPVSISKILSLKRLTSTEMKIAKHLASGLSIKEIAEIQNLSPSTVNNHRHNIIRNTGVKSMVGLAHYALYSGLCSSAESILPDSFFTCQDVKSQRASSQTPRDAGQ